MSKSSLTITTHEKKRNIEIKIPKERKVPITYSLIKKKKEEEKKTIYHSFQFNLSKLLDLIAAVAFDFDFAFAAATAY